MTGRPAVRAPLVPVGIALVAGISAGRLGPMTTGFWAVLGAAALVAALITFRRPHLHLVSSGAVLLAIAAGGAVHLHLSAGTAGPDHIATFTPQSSMLATLRGQVVTAPKIRAAGSAIPGWPRPPRTNFILRAESIRTAGGWRRTSGLVRVTVKQPARHVRPGQRLELVGRIGRFGKPGNPGQTDWSQFARRTGVYVLMTVEVAEGAAVLGDRDKPAWWARALWHLRASVRQHLLACADSREGHLLNALILGERDPALRRLNESMVRAGIAHFLSISGLHLGIFLGFVYLLCRLAMARPRRSAIIVLVVLSVYLLLAEPRAPLLRSAIMAAALCLSVIAHRQYAALNALAAAAIVLLVVDPMQMFGPGFQLSFMIVGGLILLHDPVRRFLFGRWLRRRGLMVFRHEQHVRRWVYHSLANALIDLVAMCLSAHLVAAPLVAYHFGLFNPYAPLLSLLIFPLVLAVLVPGYISMALAWPMPGLAASVQRLALGAADTLAGAVRATEALPGLSFPLRPVGPGFVLLCYAAVVLLVVRRRIRFGRILAGVAIAAAAALGAYTQRTSSAPRVAELDLLSVGSGQCAVLRTPSGQTYLIDAGTQSGYSVWSEVLAPFLRARRLPVPRAAFISHANTDHYNALPEMLDRTGLPTVYLNDYFGAADRPPETEAEMINRLVDHDVRILRLRAGRRVELDARTSVEVLWPPASKPGDLNLNDTSLVLRVTCDGRSVLIPGDIEETAQSRLLESGADLRADVLVMPHHGTWRKSLPRFFAVVSPSVVLLSGWRDPDTAYTTDDRRREFFSTFVRGRRYYSTPRNGWVHVRFGGEGPVRVETMRGGKERGRN